MSWLVRLFPNCYIEIGSLSDFADIKALAGNDASLLQSLEPAFRKYNEEQYATVKLPGSSEAVWTWTMAWTGWESYLTRSRSS